MAVKRDDFFYTVVEAVALFEQFEEFFRDPCIFAKKDMRLLQHPQRAQGYIFDISYGCWKKRKQLSGYFSSLYLFLNFSTRPVASTIFSDPVKKGWHALQISILISGLFESTVKWFPHAQVTLHSTYSGWIPFFIAVSLCIDLASHTTAACKYNKPLLLRGRVEIILEIKKICKFRDSFSLFFHKNCKAAGKFCVQYNIKAEISIKIFYLF